MADPAIARDWLEKADEDFRFAEANLRLAAGKIAHMVREGFGM